jgi:hypothetical protein
VLIEEDTQTEANAGKKRNQSKQGRRYEEVLTFSSAGRVEAYWHAVALASTLALSIVDFYLLSCHQSTVLTVNNDDNDSQRESEDQRSVQSEDYPEYSLFVGCKYRPLTLLLEDSLCFLLSHVQRFNLPPDRAFQFV